MKKRGVERSGRRGVVLLIAAGMMFVLFAFMGLALDVGYLQWSRRRAQTAGARVTRRRAGILFTRDSGFATPPAGETRSTRSARRRRTQPEREWT